jgi:phage shock protein E
MNRPTRWLVCVAATMATLGLPAAAAEPQAKPDATPVAAPAPAATPISQSALLERLATPVPDLLVLDVRTPAEYAAGHLPGARNVPHDQLAARLADLEAFKDRDVVLYCRSGRRSQLAAQTLRSAGFSRLLHLEGDWLAWEGQNRPVETQPAAGAQPRKLAD